MNPEVYPSCYNQQTILHCFGPGLKFPAAKTNQSCLDTRKTLPGKLAKNVSKKN